MSVFDLFRRGNRVSETVQRERLAVCDICPEKAGPICGVCGCVLAAKSRLLTEECPRHRWPEISTSSQ